MAGKVIEHFTGQSLFEDWVVLVQSTHREAGSKTPQWAKLHPVVAAGWEHLAVRLNTKVHAGTTTSINPNDYLAKLGVIVDADAEDTFTDGPQGPDIRTIRVGPGGQASLS